MRLVNADPRTVKVPGPPEDAGDGSTTRLLVRPVFTREGEGRRRFLVRGGYLAAISGLAYLAMVLVSITASPAARPAAVAAPEVTAPTTVRQVTPERPSIHPSAPVLAVPATGARSRPPAAPPPTPAPPAARTTAAAPTAEASVLPSAVKPSKHGSTPSSPAVTQTVAAKKTTTPSRVA